MTEDEAKTKWCPHAVASHTNPRELTKYDRDGNDIPEPRFRHNCIGSACMAWRWHPNWGNSPENPDACIELPPIEGFCGLAGRP